METTAVEAAANSQSAQNFGANTDTGAIELFRIDWLMHLVHNSVSNRVITKVEYMFLTKLSGEILIQSQPKCVRGSV